MGAPRTSNHYHVVSVLIYKKRLLCVSYAGKQDLRNGKGKAKRDAKKGVQK